MNLPMLFHTRADFADDLGFAFAVGVGGGEVGMAVQGGEVPEIG